MLGWRRSRRLPRLSDTRVGSVPWTARDWGGSGSRTGSRPRGGPRGEATDTATAAGMDAPLRTWMCLSRAADMEVRMSTKLDVDVTELWREFKEHPTTPLRNRLVERYLPLVKYNAERIWQRLPEGVDLDDLISAGVFGLMDAIDAFDLGRGVKFETYCVPRIRGAMLDELRTMDWVPRLVRSKATKMEEARKALEAQHGRPPTDVELAEQMGLPMEEYEKMATDANAVGLISLNKKWYETDSYKDVREIDILEDKKGEDPTRRLQRKDLMRMVTKGLNRNERLIIILYYYEELTMKEIGATLDLSESRVSQMHSSIIQRLQSQLSTRRPEFGT